MAYSGSNPAFFGHPHTNYVHGILAPPNVAVDSRRTAAQLAINDLTGIQGIAPRAMQQYSAQDLATMGTPAMSTQGIGSPEIATPMATAIELLTIFRAEEVFPGMLGPNGVAPLTPTNEKAIYFDKLVFNQQLPDVRPLRGRVNFGTAYRQQRVSTMRDFGIGIEFTYQFLKGREGPLYLRLSIEQLNNAVVDHLLLMAYDTLQSAVDWGALLWDKQLTTIGARIGSVSIMEFLQRDILLLGLIQKKDRPLETIMEFVQNEQAREQGAISNAIVMHHRIRGYISKQVHAYMEFFRAGDAGPAAVKATPDQVLNMHFNGWAMNVVRANTVDDAQEFPFMQNEWRYGEFYVMESDVSPANDPNGEFYCDAIEVYNQHSDSKWARIELMDALRNSGRFSPNPGEPIGLTTDIAIRRADFVNTPNAGAYDLFTTPDGETVQTIGDLRDIPRERLVAIANAIERLGGGKFGVGLAKITPPPPPPRIVRGLPPPTSLPPTTSPPTGHSLGAEVPSLPSLAGLDVASRQLLRFLEGSDQTLYGRVQDAVGDIRAAYDLALNATEPAQIKEAWERLGTSFLVAYETVQSVVQSYGSRLPLGAEPIPERELGAWEASNNTIRELGRVIDVYLQTAASAGVNNTLMTRLSERALPASERSVQKRIEQELIGSWVQSGKKTMKLVNNSSATLVANGSLKCNSEGCLDNSSSTLGAKYALAILHNCKSNTDEQNKSHNILLHGLSYVNKTGSSAQVGARLEAFANSMVRNEVLPSNFAGGPFTIEAAPASVSSAITAYMKSDEAKRTGVFGSASHRDFASDVAAMQTSSSSRIGAEIPSLIGASGYEEERAMLEGVVKDAVSQVVRLPINLSTMERFITNKIPLPFRVVLLRPYIRLITYGMIACFTGAQRVYYGLPIFSWLSDGHSQVTRGVLSYSCGSAVQNEKTIFHLPHVLIADIAGGWGINWIKGGRQNEWDNPYHEKYGDMLALIEPLDSPLTRTTEVITAYGSFSEVEMLRKVPLNKNENGDCFKNREWVRAWFGIANKQRAVEGEATAAYTEGERSQHMICWNGGYRLYNPKKGDWCMRRPSGPFADAEWYGPGMAFAFRTNTRPRSQEASRLEIMGH